ncbi:hypothetical protein BU26DRAFT_506827 [Trematosphaeria pertusa]|uniref:Uncharacterized protein n=1 Tax=Trematosphaeria pertusa TaxID=390896 RepID=A0A6A6IB51_9PLEO|nr:uncharacterized protein BU26DRAFT_506827 [Trematosphaeria pertusa]KAF2247621.1 hypothetical protein BU26DRAFT_506827 [Trematosphaeria pertusa]
MPANSPNAVPRTAPSSHAFRRRPSVALAFRLASSSSDCPGKSASSSARADKWRRPPPGRMSLCTVMPASGATLAASLSRAKPPAPAQPPERRRPSSSGFTSRLSRGRLSAGACATTLCPLLVAVPCQLVYCRTPTTSRQGAPSSLY